MIYPGENQRLENEIQAVGAMQPVDVHQIEWIDEEIEDADAAGDITEKQAYQLKQRLYSLMRS